MRARGRDYFVMFLARELRMTRRQLLCSIDSREFSMWQAFFHEMNKPQAQKKQSPDEIATKLKNAFAVHAKRKKKK